ncbi:MAG: peptide deformylase [Patescibacteria group bacterium]|mgnify:FL=1
MNILVDRKHLILRQIAKEVPIQEIGSPRLRKILKGMKKALNAEDDSVAIAAPQIGVPLRVFIVSGRAFELGKYHEIHKKNKEIGERNKKPTKPDLVCINPKIKKESRDTAWMIEGCLSLRWLYGSVKRKKKIIIEAYDETGKKFTRGASGLLAQIFQHETDHLNGILFTDKAREIENIPPEPQKTHHEQKVV